MLQRSPASKLHSEDGDAAPRRIGRFDGLRHVVRLIAAMLARPECPVAAVSEGVLRPHLAGQLVERLAAEGGVLHPIGRDDAVSGRGSTAKGCRAAVIAGFTYIPAGAASRLPAQ